MMDDDDIRTCGDALWGFRDRAKIMEKLHSGEELFFEELETLDIALSEYLMEIRDLQSRVRMRMSDFD